MKHLKIIKKKRTGRSSSGQVVVRHQGGEHKRYLRLIDFKRMKVGIRGKVIGIEYDPNRTADIALIQYIDGDKKYILAPDTLSVGDSVMSGSQVEIRPGNAMPLSEIPVGTMVHNVELTRGKGGQTARSAGSGAVISAKEGKFVHLRMPSGEMRRVHMTGYATIGQLGNIEWKDEVMGKAGRNRHRGIRPTVRGVAQNPRSHPHGGGEGRSGIGMTSPKNYTGRVAVGKTRNKKKHSNKFIITRRSSKSKTRK